MRGEGSGGKEWCWNFVYRNPFSLESTYLLGKELPLNVKARKIY